MDEKNAFNTDLDPEVIKIRDKIISKIGDKPLEEVNSIIKKLLNESMDEVTRLGALAARLKIIRSKIDLLYERKVEIKPEKQVVKTKEEKNDEKPKKSEENWIRIKMLEAGEVNGKQIDKGVILDVKEEDGKKLVESKKAEVIEEVSEGASPIQKPEETKKETEIKNNKKEDPKIGEKSDSPLKQDPKTDQNANSNKATKQVDKDLEENSKAKNLLEKHEDAVQDDDKNQEIDSKKLEKTDEVSNDNKEQKSKIKDQDNALDSNEKDKDSILDENEKHQKASNDQENLDNVKVQDTEPQSNNKENENKIEAKKDSLKEETNEDKVVEKELK